MQGIQEVTYIIAKEIGVCDNSLLICEYCFTKEYVQYYLFQKAKSGYLAMECQEVTFYSVFRLLWVMYQYRFQILCLQVEFFPG